MPVPDTKRRPRRRRLPSRPEQAAGRAAVAGPASLRPVAGEEDSIYTLRGYKAWAARVKAAWDAES
jgi:hypothetical protein